MIAEEITFRASERTPGALELAASLLGLSRTDVINRAIQAYAVLVMDEARGAVILSLNKNGETARLKFLDPTQ